MKPFEALGTHYIKCCATCKHWDPWGESQYGQCTDAAINQATDGTHDFKFLTTLDLQLCSRWEEKEDADRARPNSPTR